MLEVPMQLEYLRSFLEVYRTGSMTAAARNLNMTQPAISSQIKSLEASLEKPLFQRVGRGIQATPIAIELAHSISSPLDSLATTLGLLKARSNQIEGTVYIAGPGEFMHYAAARILAGLMPLNIKLRLQTGNRKFLIDQLESGEADIVFLAAQHKPEQFEYHSIACEQLIPVASPEWANMHFNSCRKVEDLITKPIMAYDEELSLAQRYFNATIQQSCITSPVACVPDLRIVLELLYQHQGYAVLPDYLCQKPIEQKRLVQLIDHPLAPKNCVHMAWQKQKMRDSRVYFVKDYLEKAFQQKI
ncbi:MAG TPA: hypothetical protein DDW29_01045 [Gammaproteobacteria bacterium]|nr:hypothetical protein [Gammaproteobacteria bacterium]